jgi:phage portal protein BeeE
VANLNQEQLRRLARLGAMARLEQLKQEEAAIRGEFPELFGRGRQAQQANGAVTSSRRRRRRAMSAAARKAVSQRLRKYWADRRKAKGGK